MPSTHSSQYVYMEVEYLIAQYLFWRSAYRTLNISDKISEFYFSSLIICFTCFSVFHGSDDIFMRECKEAFADLY